MKQYLGLGVVFSAIEKGLARNLKTTAEGVQKVDSELGKTEKTASAGGKKGGVFHGLYDGIKLLSLSHIGSTLTEIHEAMTGVGGGIEDTFRKLDTLQSKLAFTFDGTQAQNLNNSLLSTMRISGLTGDQIEVMAEGMMEFGRSSKEASQSLPMMGKLVGVMGMDAGKVTQMFGQGLATLRATPDAIEGVTKEVVALQKAYHLTDQVSNLPDIFATVTKNSAMFGKVNSQTALSTVRSISGLSAVFQKIGMSQQQALSASTGFADKLGSLKRSVQDLKAGLDPLDNDLYDAAQTLTLMGISGQDAFSKILEGADDPQKLAKDLNATFATLGKEQQDVVAARFRRIFGDDATNLLQGYGDEAKKAFDIGDKAMKGVDANKTFDQYSASLTSTVAVQERLTDSSKAYMELMTEFVNKDKTVNVLAAQRKGWDALTSAVTDADSILGKVITTLTAFKNLGIAGFVTALAPIGIMLGFLTPLIFPLANLVSLMKILGALPFKLISSGLALIFSGPGLAIAGLVAGVALLMTVFKDDLPYLSDLAKKVFGEVSDFFSSMFEGATIEKTIGAVRGFIMELVPVAKTAFGIIFEIGQKTFGYFMDVAKMLMPAFKKGFEIVSGLFLKFWSNIKTVIDGVKSLFSALSSSENIEGPLGSAIQSVEIFAGIFESSSDTISTWITNLSGFTDFLSGAFEFIGSQIQAVLEIAGGFYKGFFAGILDNMPELLSTFKAFKSAAAGAFSTITMIAGSLFKIFGGLLSYFKVGESSLTSLHGTAELVGFALSKIFSAVAITLGTVVNLVLGIVSAIGKILDVSATVAAALVFAFTSPVDAMKLLASSISETFDSVFNSITGKWDEFWTGLLDKVPDYIKSVLGMDVSKAIKVPEAPKPMVMEKATKIPETEPKIPMEKAAKVPKTEPKIPMEKAAKVPETEPKISMEKAAKPEIFQSPIVNVTVPEIMTTPVMEKSVEQMRPVNEKMTQSPMIDNVATSAPEQELPKYEKVIPIKQQKGVPAAPTFQEFSKQKTEKVDDPNTQALLDEISQLRQMLAKLAQSMMDRPVMVEIKGDMKRLFQAINQEQKNHLGANMAGGSF